MRLLFEEQKDSRAANEEIIEGRETQLRIFHCVSDLDFFNRTILEETSKKIMKRRTTILSEI